MSLDKYDYNFLIKPFGLHNSGAVCYLNSLMQSLTSLPSFVKLLHANDDKFKESKYNLGTRLLELCKNFDCTSDFTNAPMDNNFRHPEIASISGILAQIQKIRSDQGRISNLHTGMQEDVFEGFKFLVECMDSTNNLDGEEFLTNFAVRHRLNINCTSCKKTHNADRSSAPEEIMVNMADRNPLLQANLDSQLMIENYIKMHMLYPDDYRCENCNVKNNIANGDLHIKQFYSLARISSVIVLSFHHNHQVLLENAFARPGQPRKQRTVAWFPSELGFVDGKGQLLKYRIVAQIEQFGSLNSGHYVASCLRPRPPGHSQTRLASAKKALRELQERFKVARTSDDNDRINKLTEYMNKMSKFIKNEEHCINSDDPYDKLGVFKFDDRQITYKVEGFAPSEHTYLVFYHLF